MKRSQIVVLIFATAIGLTLSSCRKYNHDADSFAITDITVGAGEKGLETPRVEFALNEKIWITYDVNNITAMNSAGSQYFWIRQDIMVQDEKGAIVLVKPSVLDVKKTVAEKPVKFINEVSLQGIENIKPGRFTATLLVTDIVGFQTATQKARFTVK